MDASDASIRSQLLSVQSDLLDAYDRGHDELVAFMHKWATLKDQLIAAASAHLLSRETLQLAADVAKPVAAIASSLLALQNASATLASQLTQDTKKEVLNTLTAETDAGDSDSDGPPGSDSGFDDEDDEDPDAPKYEILRDWFYANIRHPFASREKDHGDLLTSANITYDQFLTWLDFVRDKSGWSHIFSLHARTSPRRMEKLCSQVFDELDHGVPRLNSALPLTVRDDFRKLRMDIERVYHFDLSDWWEPVTDLFEEAGLSLWNESLDIEQWLSDECLSENESIATTDSDEDSLIIDQPQALESGVRLRLSTPSTIRRLQLAGSKRKAEELAVNIPDNPTELVPSAASESNYVPQAKRRKVDNVKLEPLSPRFYPSPLSLLSPSCSSPDYSQSSRGSSSQPSLSSRSTPAASVDYPSNLPSSISSTISASKHKLPFVPTVSLKPDCTNPQDLQDIKPFNHSSAKAISQVQVVSESQEKSIRSPHGHLKRKREPNSESNITSPMKPVHAIPTAVKRTKTVTTNIHNFINTVDSNSASSHGTREDPDISRPSKRLRENHVLPSSNAIRTGQIQLPTWESCIRSSQASNPSTSSPNSGKPKPAAKCQDSHRSVSTMTQGGPVTMPSAMVPSGQEATSLVTAADTTNLDDMLSWLKTYSEPPRATEVPPVVNLPSSEIPTTSNPSNEDLPRPPSSNASQVVSSPYPWITVDTVDKYLSSNDAFSEAGSTPHLDWPSPNDTASTPGYDVRTPTPSPFSTAEATTPKNERWYHEAGVGATPRVYDPS